VSSPAHGGATRHQAHAGALVELTQRKSRLVPKDPHGNYGTGTEQIKDALLDPGHDPPTAIPLGLGSANSARFEGSEEFFSLEFCLHGWFFSQVKRP
jgi:hypothetical protein